jgi:hypothetical protein
VSLDKLELHSKDAELVKENCFIKVHGLLEEHLKENWVAPATVGANRMIGKHYCSEQAKS